LVKFIGVIQSSQPMVNISLGGVSVITGLQGAGSSVQIDSNGKWIGTWDGTNGNGDPVLNGVYHIQVDNIDSLGAVTSTTQQVTISRSLARVTVNIYNEAGEVVRHLYATVASSMDSSLTDLILSRTVLSLSGSQGGGTGSMGILVDASGAPSATLSWDGRSDSGVFVSAGKYWVEARWDNGKGGNGTITKDVTVTGVEAQGTAWAQPNRLSGTALQTTFNVGSPLATLTVRIYSLEGELVKVVKGGSGTSQAVWDAQGVASGTYLADVQWFDGGGKWMGRKTLRLMVIH